MTIKKLVLGKRGCYITFEDNSVIKINYETGVKFGLRKGDSLDEKRLLSLKKEDEALNCKHSVFRVLSRRKHSRYELFQKMLVKGYEKYIIIEVLNSLENSGFIDDLDFTRSFVDSKLSLGKYGLNRIKADLKKKGISAEIVEVVLTEISPDESQYRTALKLANKKKIQLEKRVTDKYKMKKNIYSFLVNRGFSYEMVSRIIDSLFI